MKPSDSLALVADRIGQLFDLSRHPGWAAKDLIVEHSEQGERWSIELIGPIEAYVDEAHFAGGNEPLGRLRVESGSHGRIYASTAAELERMVAEWTAIVWGTA